MSKYTLFLLFVVLSFVAACASETGLNTNPYLGTDAVGESALRNAGRQAMSDVDSSTRGVSADVLNAWMNMMGNDTSSGGSVEVPFVSEDASPKEKVRPPEEQETRPRPADDTPSEADYEAAIDESKGACDNTADKDSLFALDNINTVIMNCALGCIGEETCSANCVSEDTGVSEECGKCFVATISCTMKHCVLKCMNAESPGCQSCQATHCYGPFEECAGLEPPTP